jgi:hypothetical protein
LNVPGFFQPAFQICYIDLRHCDILHLCAKRFHAKVQRISREDAKEFCAKAQRSSCKDMIRFVALLDK